MKPKVTIQGVAGCYHDAAARAYFAPTEIDTVPCDTFQAMFETLDTDASLIGILAIENTIAGALLQNHELLRKSNLTIVGEHKMRISHVLAALPGQPIDSLTEVNSPSDGIDAVRTVSAPASESAHCGETRHSRKRQGHSPT